MKGRIVWAAVLGWAATGVVRAQDDDDDVVVADTSESTTTEDSKYLFGLEQWDLSDTIQKEEYAEFLDFGGWVQAGYTSRSTGLFNSNPDRLNVHQVWFYVEKAADGSEGLDWGFKVSAMYGTDADDTQAFGNSPGEWDFANGWDRGGGYGFAFPELYGEVAYEDFSVIGGHFYTLLGWEVVPAPGNFFYSHALTMYNSEAFTHTGILASYSGLGEEIEALEDYGIELYGGWTLGWDTGFDQVSNGTNFLGGASITPIEDVNVIFITTVGDFGAIGTGYSHSIVVDWMINEDLEYTFQSDYLDAGGFDTIGINQYLIYSINELLGVGGRFEWWKGDGDNYFVATAGVNVHPIGNVTIRPEVRYQWSPDDPVNPIVPENDELIFGVDAILTY